MASSLKRFLPILFLVSGIILGLFLSNFWSINGKSPSEKIAMASPLFDSQIATIKGSVTQVSGSDITIKADNNKIAKFKASDKIMVFKRDPKLPIPQSFAGTGALELNQKAGFVLVLENGQFKVSSVRYTINSTAVNSTPSAVPALKTSPAPINKKK